MITKKIYFMIFAILLFAVSVHADPIVSSSTAVISIDTDAATFHCSDPDSGIITGVIVATRFGASEAIITLPEGLTITSGATVNVTGSNALRIVATTGDINLDAVIDLTPTVLGRNNEPGPGTVGGWDGGDEDQDDAKGPGKGAYISQAGGGGSYGGRGGQAARGGAGPAPYGDQEMYILLGGSGGGGSDNTGGGGGGSAVALISLNGNISIGATGKLICDGGDIQAPQPESSGGKWVYGAGDPNSVYGPYADHVFPTDPAVAVPTVRGYMTLGTNWDEKGGGGGSGGGILLAAGNGTVTVDGIVSANGGKGADNTDDWDEEKNDNGGGGGGGRIAIYSASGSAGGSGTITADGGTHGATMDPDGYYKTPFGQLYITCNSEEGDGGTIYYGTGPVPLTAKNGVPDYTTGVSIFASLTWESAASASQAVYINGAEVLTGDQNLESAVTADIGGPLAGNTAYNWHVTTDGGDDYSTWTFTTDNGVSTVPSPANLAVGPVTDLSWTGVSGAVSYNVYYSDVYADIAGDIGGVSIAAGSDPNLPVTGLAEGAQYWWRVDAVGPDGDVAPGTVWTFVPSATLSINDLPVPTGPIGDDAPIHVVDITWVDAADPNYDVFDVYEGATPGSMTRVGTVNRADPNENSINFANLPAPSYLPLMTKHYCQIVARDTSLVKGPVSSFVWEWTTRDQICTTPIAGDINGDCKVDETDLVALVEHWLNNNLWTGDE